MAKTTTLPPVAIIGAGAIGTVVGLSLAQNPNQKLLLIGRKSLMTAVQENNDSLRMRDKARSDQEIVVSVGDSTNVMVTEDWSLLPQYPIIIVATKTTATASVAEQLAQLLPLDSAATILSFQNGVRNASIFKKALETHKNVQILPCMVGFNASWEAGTNLFHKNTDGGIKIQQPANDSPPIQALVNAMTQHHIPATLVPNIQPDQYSKLLINLFNAINALAGLSTPATLQQTGYRRVHAAAIAEGLAVYQQNGIATTSFRGMPARLLPWMGVLPETLFQVVLRGMYKMNDTAKSSMLQDLERQRATTEIDDLCGEIVKLAGQETPVPVNKALVRLVQQATRDNQGSPKLAARQLLSEVGLEK